MTPDAARQKQLEIYRSMTPEERLNLALRLYELACEVSRCGIRHQHPGATAEEVENLLRERIALGNQIEDWKLIYD